MSGWGHLLISLENRHADNILAGMPGGADDSRLTRSLVELSRPANVPNPRCLLLTLRLKPDRKPIRNLGESVHEERPQ